VYQDRIYPAVRVADMNVGGLSEIDARTLLQRRADGLEQGTVTFRYGDLTWQPKLTELGARFNVDAAIERASTVGRQTDAQDRLLSTIGLLRHDQLVPLPLNLDQATLNAWFDGVDSKLGLPPHDAALSIDGSRVTIVPEVDGTVVDRTQATRTILSALVGLQPIEAPLPVVSWVPRVRAGDLAAAEQQVQEALAKRVKLTFEGKSWMLAPADFGQFVKLRIDETKQGADAASIAVDEQELAAWLNDRYAADVERESVNAKVAWDGNALVALKESQTGLKLKPQTFARAVAASFLEGHEPVAVPVTELQPDVDSTNLEALGIVAELGVGSSNFEGSDDGRATNVRVGAERLNGTLVPPGGMFSFNQSIGYISPDKGFVESNVVDGERIGRDIGGGICQVSTTVFRAALYAGLPFEEWHPHRYRLGFYEYDGWEPGLDASILQLDEELNGGDLKFENTTDSWLLIESYTDGPKVVVTIYGPELDYSVDLQGPDMSAPVKNAPDLETVNADLPPGTIKQTEWPMVGVDVNWERSVYDGNGELILADSFYSPFSARGNVYQVSPDMVGTSPASR
jgi:vancomycin resistance protein YoaR